MTSLRALLLATLFFGSVTLGLGCTSRETANTTDANGAIFDAGSDALASAMPDAFVERDAGHDAASSLMMDAGHDAAIVSTSDGGCPAPTCPDLPASCHYDASLDACRCGMVVCDVPPPCATTCGALQYCAYVDGTCGGSGGGACTTMPDACLDNFDPVCGCDGHTYGNACDAAAAGQNVAFSGECVTPTDCRTVGCDPGSTCMGCRGAGFVCLTDGTVC